MPEASASGRGTQTADATGIRLRLLSKQSQPVLQDGRDAGRQRLADGVERLVDAASEGAHAGGCAESDEGDDQSIFNQILTFFAVNQVLELDVEIEKQVIHSMSLHSAISQPQPGTFTPAS